MIDEAKKTIEILRKRAAQNVYVNTFLAQKQHWKIFLGWIDVWLKFSA